MKRFLRRSLGLTCGLAAFISPAFSQQALPVAELTARADSLYQAKQFGPATTYYGMAAERSDFKLKQADAYYNMACCLSLRGQADSALLILGKAVDAGFANQANMLADNRQFKNFQPG